MVVTQNAAFATIKTSGQRAKDDILRAQLLNEKSSFRTHWRDLTDNILPRRGRFFITDANRGEARNTKIIDSTATLAARTLRSGLMSGVTSPSRPWFKLTAPGQEVDEFGPVTEWLTDVTDEMNRIFLKSNLYNILPIAYGDLGVFGTAAIYIEEDFDDVIHLKSFPIGSYALAKNEKGVVDTFFREFQMTVEQVVKSFGFNRETGKIDWRNISEYVRSQYENGQRQLWVWVYHLIEPNQKYDPTSELAEKKLFRSAYWETGVDQNNITPNFLTGGGSNTYLSQGGHDFFPLFGLRWETTGEDIYGTNCPGMQALGDIKALQILMKRKAQAVEKMVNPPMVGSPEMKNTKASILPGDITYAEEREGTRGFRPAHEVKISLTELRNDIQEHQQLIKRAFYEDLFLMLANTDRRQITATEIRVRQEEKLLALGPVLEQLNQDLLDPLIDATFQIMLNQGLVPEPPDELRGQDIKVEYISIMAQAQKLVGLGAVERFTGFVGQMAAFDPRVLAKFNSFEATDIYADITSVRPGIVRSNEKAEAILEEEARAAAAAQQAEILKQSAAAAKDLSQASLEGDNALTRLATAL